MCCENCKCEHKGEYGSGRFCSSKCARGFSTKEKRSLINEKVSLKLKKSNESRLCVVCGINEFKRKDKKTCSRTCGSKLKWMNPEYKEKLSKISSINAYKKHQNGIGFGWSTRKKLEPSYPESIAINILNELNVEYEREYKIGKYFIDFVLHDKKIAIEIDGQQHKIPERKLTDNKKDELLKTNGWKVFRISFPEENIIERIKEILASTPSA